MGPEAKSFLRERFEERKAGVHGVVCASGRDKQLGRSRGLGTSKNWSGHKSLSAVGMGGGQLLRQRHADSAERNVDSAFVQATGNARIAEDDTFNGVIVREHRHSGVALARVGDLSGVARALLHQRLRLAGGAVET